jgi:hypothetical protein
MEKWTKLIGAVVGLGTIGGSIVTFLVLMADSSAARAVSPVKERVVKLETVWPLIDRKLDILIEVEGQREWRERRVSIPTTIAAPRDGGTP